MREKNKELYEKYWEKVRNLKPVIEYDEIYKDRYFASCSFVFNCYVYCI